MHQKVFDMILPVSAKHRITMQPGTVMATHRTTGDRLLIDTTYESMDKLVYHTQLKADGRLVREHYPDLFEALRSNNFLEKG